MESNKSTNTKPSSKKQYPNGDIYTGDIINNLREGKGTLIRNKPLSFIEELNQAIEFK